MFISPSLLDSLSQQAQASPRLRQNYDLRNSETDKSQRMLNAVEPGSIMPIHQPQLSSFVERFVRISMMTMEILLKRCFSNGSIRAVQIEKGRWHNLESFESGSVLFDAKDGEWEPYELFNK